MCHIAPSQALHIIFNVALIVATAVLAHKDNVFPRILFPLFTMCFVIALFTPISFVRDTSQFIARQTITVALQPAIGILISENATFERTKLFANCKVNWPVPTSIALMVASTNSPSPGSHSASTIEPIFNDPWGCSMPSARGNERPRWCN